MPDDLGVSEQDIDFSATEHVTDAQWRARGYDKCGCGEWNWPDSITFCKIGLVGGSCGNRWCEDCLKERLCGGDAPFSEALADTCMNRETCPECLLDIDKRDRLLRRAEAAERKLEAAVLALQKTVSDWENFSTEWKPFYDVAREALKEIGR